MILLVGVEGRVFFHKNTSWLRAKIKKYNGMPADSCGCEAVGKIPGFSHFGEMYKGASLPIPIQTLKIPVRQSFFDGRCSIPVICSANLSTRKMLPGNYRGILFQMNPTNTNLTVIGTKAQEATSHDAEMAIKLSPEGSLLFANAAGINFLRTLATQNSEPAIKFLLSQHPGILDLNGTHNLCFDLNDLIYFIDVIGNRNEEYIGFYINRLVYNKSIANM